jgi:hypothetical protein
MATYLPNVQAVFPERPSFTPDFSFLTKVLTTQQQRYDANFMRVKSLYNSQFNKALSNSDNIEFRNLMLKKMDQEIAGIANLDLALPQNVSSAMTVFNPLLQDNDLQSDLVKTQRAQQAFQQYQQYAQSTDPNIRAQANPAAMQYIQIGVEELQNAKRGDGSIQAVQSRDFVPFEDYVKYLDEAANKEKLQIKYTAQKGYYLVDIENGKEAILPFSSWALGHLGNRFDRQFAVLAEVDKYNGVKAFQQQGMSYQDALKAYAKQVQPDLVNTFVEAASNSTDRMTEVDAKLRFFNDTYGNDIPPQFKERYEQLKAAKTALDEQTKNNLNVASEIANADDIRLSNAIVNHLFSSKKQNAAIQWGTNRAMATQSMTMKPDDVKLKFAQMAHDRSMKLLDHELAKERDYLKFTYDYKIGVAKGDIVPTEVPLGRNTDIQSVSALTAANTLNSQGVQQMASYLVDPKGGLLNFVAGSEKGAVYSSLVSKMASHAKSGGKITYSQQELSALRELTQSMGVSFYAPDSPQKAGLMIANISTGVYQRATLASGAINEEAGGIRHTKDAIRNASALVRALNNSWTETTTAQDDYQAALRLEVMSGNRVKSEYADKVSVIGTDRNGRPIISVIKPFEEAVERKISATLPQRYQNITTTSGDMVQFNRVTGADVGQLFNQNNVQKVVIDGKDVTSDYKRGESDFNEAIKGVNINDLAELYGNNAEIAFNPVSKTADITFRVSPSSKAASGVNYKKDGFAGNEVKITVPYSQLGRIMPRTQPYLGANTFSPQSLVNLDKFATEPFSVVEFPSYMESAGFKGTISGQVSGDGGYALIIQGTKRVNGKDVPFKYPVTQNIMPGDANALNAVETILEQEFQKYLDQSN